MKRRILFVDDNPVLLAMYGMMVEAQGDDWEVATSADPREALSLLAVSTFDVVVSDFRMPGMNGVEFLAEVRERCPTCSRIIVSGIGDQTEVVRCVNSTHQFLAKPVDMQVLRSTLARIGGVQAYLTDEKLKGVVGQLVSFPSFPSLYVEVMKELSRPEPSLEAIDASISRDPGMTAKILQLANSAAMGLPRRLSAPFEAIQFLGLETVRSLVLSTHIFSCFEHTNLKGLSIAELWRHTVRTGKLARDIMKLEGAEASEIEDANVAGVLHDVGKLMLADGLPDKFQQALALAAERRIPLDQTETEIFGATHAGVAAYLLGLWGLPASIVEAVGLHHTPGRTENPAFGPLAAVHVANVLDHEMSWETAVGAVPLLDLDYLRHIGVEERIEDWRQAAMRGVGA